MILNISIKNVPETLAAKLRARAALNHRSLQGELMAILESAATDSHVLRAGTAAYGVETAPVTDNLLARLTAIAGERGIDTTTRLTREQAHDRVASRAAGA